MISITCIKSRNFTTGLMAISPFIAAINQIVDEKGIAKEKVIETIEAAVAAAYRREYGKPSQIIRIKLDEETGEFHPSQYFEILESDEETEDHERQKTLKEAKKIDKKAKAGEEISIPLEVHANFGRIAAQTAKQVIIQRLREAERDVIFDEFQDKAGQLLTGSVQQLDGENVIISLGKANAILPSKEKIPGERYRIGQRLRVFVKDVSQSNRGPQILVSRTDPKFIIELFAIEVPEIPAGSVEIKSISREAGSRSKIAVTTSENSIDPVGSCVGQRGTRVQAVLNEIGDEKIDIILWDASIEQFIKNALSPAKIEDVKIKNESQAVVYVEEDQLSLAIGKNGQNVRLASKLTNYNIDVEEAKKIKKSSEEKIKDEKEDRKKIEKQERSNKTKKKIKNNKKDK